MDSFFGGIPGQSFKFSAVFPSRSALREDLKKQPYSSIGLNEFVFVSYGLYNLTLDEAQEKNNYKLSTYEQNEKDDLDNYENRTFNSTLWQKIYKENLLWDKDKKLYWYENAPYVISDIEYLETLEASGYCYICLGTFTGTTPKIDFLNNKVIAPGANPFIDFDGSKLDNPKITLNLPRAIQFHWVKELPNLANEIDLLNNVGDYYIKTSFNELGFAGEVFILSNKIIEGRNQLSWEITGNYLTPTFQAKMTELPEGFEPQINVISPGELGLGSNQWRFDFQIPKGATGETGPAGSATVIGYIEGSWGGTLDDKEASIINTVRLSIYHEILTLEENKGHLAVVVRDLKDKTQSYWVCYPNYPKGKDEGYVVVPLVGGDNSNDRWEELE